MTYAETLRVGFSTLSEQEMKSGEAAPDANRQEVQWRKGFEFVRAKRHRAAGLATIYDLNTLRKDPRIVITNADYRQALAKEY